MSLAVLLAAIVGCAGQRIASYDYHKPSALTGVGRFNLTFNPDLGFRDTDYGSNWEVAGPYQFNTQYLHADEGAVRGRICSIHIESVVSEFRFDFDGCDQDVWSDRGDVLATEPKMLLGFGVPDIEMPYEDMRVRFSFEIEGIDGELLDSGTVDEIVTRNQGTTVLR